jgi:hypothetical protein
LTDEPAPSLPPRPPRSLLVHFAVASAVAFLALLVVGLVLGVPFLAIVVISLLIGLAVAPSLRRAEIRALAEREHREPPT